MTTCLSGTTPRMDSVAYFGSLVVAIWKQAEGESKFENTPSVFSAKNGKNNSDSTRLLLVPSLICPPP
jgi:hypothetical protein